jgi:hypothetical protein
MAEVAKSPGLQQSAREYVFRPEIKARRKLLFYREIDWPRLDPTTGNLNSSFPKINAVEIGAIAHYGTGWIVAGQSLNADQVGNPFGLVTLANSDGTMNSSFQVSINAPVQSLVVVGQKVIIGGFSPR